jgi:hypothetical protein
MRNQEKDRREAVSPKLARPIYQAAIVCALLQRHQQNGYADARMQKRAAASANRRPLTLN